MKINAQKLAGRMRETGRTQESLANEVGISRRTIVEIIRRGEIYRTDTLMRIAEVLGLRMSDIVEGMDTIESQIAVDNVSVASVATEIKNLWMVPVSAQGSFLSETVRVRRSVLRVPFPFFSGECFAFEIEGHDMFLPADPEGSYAAGSWVIATKTELVSLRIGSAYVFQNKSGIIVRVMEGVKDDLIHLLSLSGEKSVLPLSQLQQVYVIELRISKAKTNWFSLIAAKGIGIN